MFRDELNEFTNRGAVETGCDLCLLLYKTLKKNADTPRHDVGRAAPEARRRPSLHAASSAAAADIREPSAAPAVPADANAAGVRLTALCRAGVRLRLFQAALGVGFDSANVNCPEEPRKPRTAVFSNG